MPPAATVPATTRSPGSLATGRDSPVIIDSSTSAAPVDDDAVGRDAGAGPDEDDVADRERGERDGLGAAARSPARPCPAAASASAARAPRAWAIERISSQWPSSMIVMRVASSHQISTSNRPSVPAQLVTNATTIASEIRVIIPGWRSAQLRRRAAEEDEAAVEEDDRAEDRRDAGRSPGTSGPCSRASPAGRGSRQDDGIVSARLSQNLSRNIATE